MADFSALKTAIQNNIKQNGNEEITGSILQQVLLAIVDTLGDSAINGLITDLSNEVTARQNADTLLQQGINSEASTRGSADTQLQNNINSEANARSSADGQLQTAINAIHTQIDNGYVYAGIATPSTSPATGKVFYIAVQAGTYTNFGSTVVTEGITILRYVGSSWVKEQVIFGDGGVFDVTAQNGGATFASLEALMSDDNLSTLIPAAVRRGGMSIKFVQSSDNKYVQFRLMTTSFSTTVSDWQGVDEEPTAGSNNLVKSGGVEKNFQYLNGSIIGKEEIDFSISDKNGYDIVQFKNGRIKTKNFNSESYENIDNTPQSFSDIDFSIGDGNGYDIVQFKGGHIKTKNFDSSLPIETEDLKPLLLHVVVTGQSLSVGYNSSPVLPKVNSKRAFMFKHVRSFDFGYIYNITKATYNASQDSYDNDFYQLSSLVEQSKYGTLSNAWTGNLANNEYETPCSGIAEGILNAYKKQGYSDIPYYTLFSCSGVGGVGIAAIEEGTDIFERTKKDIQYGMKAANEKGLAYKPVIVWIQGEHDSTSMSVSQYKTALTQFHTDIASFCLKLGISDIPVFSYQTSLLHSTDIDARGGSVALAQMELDSEGWFHMTYPTYALQHASDHVHLQNTASRLLGNMIGDAISKSIDGFWETLKITGAFVDGTNVTVVFNKAIVVDNDHILDTDAWTSEQNTWRENSMGFCAVDDNNNDLLTTITKTSDTSLLITCSAAPTKITYGIYPPPIGCPLGGTIREKVSILGYDDEETYRYMPTQIVNVEVRHEF